VTDVDLANILERPLPKPTDEAYVEARLLEALAEARLALEFLSRGLVRNAAGKAFQAWKALLAALLRLNRDRLVAAAKSEEEKRWILERAISVPTTRIKELSHMLKPGYPEAPLLANTALMLRDYQYHGPDPDMALSKYRTPQEAALDVVELVQHIAKTASSLAASPEVRKLAEELMEAAQRG
jgi:FAD/FMN-containing dehydrogenase